jgi:hypothetical protein
VRDDASRIVWLGNSLKPVVDGIYGGLRLVKLGKNTRRGGNLYQVVVAE